MSMGNTRMGDMDRSIAGIDHARAEKLAQLAIARATAMSDLVWARNQVEATSKELNFRHKCLADAQLKMDKAKDAFDHEILALRKEILGEDWAGA